MPVSSLLGNPVDSMVRMRRGKPIYPCLLTVIRQTVQQQAVLRVLIEIYSQGTNAEDIVRIVLHWVMRVLMSVSCPCGTGITVESGIWLSAWRKISATKHDILS